MGRAAEEATDHMEKLWKYCDEVEDMSTREDSEVSSEDEETQAMRRQAIEEERVKALTVQIRHEVADEEKQKALVALNQLVESRSEELWKQREETRKREELVSQA